MSELKVVILDIETSPGKVYSWGLYNQNHAINQVIEAPRTICMAYKYLGERGCQFIHERDGHQEMVRAIWELIDGADVVVHFNGARFDIKHLNREFTALHLPKPSSYVQVDLYKVSKQFSFFSHKLDYIVQTLGLGKKHATGGFDLWVKCLHGDLPSWKKMERYNKQDVRVTEKLFNHWRAWIPALPNLDGRPDTCNACGHDQFRMAGDYTTAAGSSYQCYRCKKCGAQRRSVKRHVGQEFRQI